VPKKRPDGKKVGAKTKSPKSASRKGKLVVAPVQSPVHRRTVERKEEPGSVSKRLKRGSESSPKVKYKWKSMGMLGFMAMIGGSSTAEAYCQVKAGHENHISNYPNAKPMALHCPTWNDQTKCEKAANTTDLSGHSAVCYWT
jgi:hypothetical protein